MKKEERSEEVKKQEALKLSIKEGSANSASNGFGDSFIIPFAQAIGANAIHVGLLSALSGLLSPISQFYGNRLMEKHSRKSIVRKNALFQALTWLPFAVLAILHWKGFFSSFSPWLLVFLYSLIAIFGGLAYAPWFSWMGDLVPEKERGKYFSKRGFYTGLVGVIISIVASFFIDKFETLNIILVGFSALFVLSSVTKMISYSYIKNQYEPKFRLPKKSEFSFISFLKRFDNYGKFAVYQSLFNFAIMIASPFFGLYMLTELGLKDNIVLFMIITMSSSVFTLILMPLSGKFSDKYGNLKLMYIANTFFIITPLLWLFSTNPIYLILVPGLSAGIANAALGIAVGNFTYDSASKEHRGICMAYTNILIGIGVFAGSLLGGFLIKYSPVSLINSFFFVFILASAARLIVALIFLPQLKEVRRVSNIPLHFHPLKTIHHEINGLGLFFHNHRGLLRKV